MIIATGLAPTTARAAGFGVAPSRIDAKVQPGQTLPPVSVRNDTDTPLTVDVGVVTITQARSGLPILDLSPAAAREGRRLVRVAPRRFTLGPRQSRQVSALVAARPRRGIAAYAAIVLTASATKRPGDAEGQIAPRVRLSTNLLLRFPGRARIDGRVTALRAEGAPSRRLDFITDIRNDGSVHARPRATLTVTGAGAAPSLRRRLRPENVLPGATREFRLRVHELLPPGEYTARVEATFGERRSTKETRFRLTGPNELPTPKPEIVAFPSPKVEAGDDFDTSVTITNRGTAAAELSGELVLAERDGGRVLHRRKLEVPRIEPGGRVEADAELPGVPEGLYRLTARLRLDGRVVAEEAVEFEPRDQPGVFTRAQDWLARHVALLVAGFAVLLALIVAAFVTYVRRLKARAARP